MRILTNPGSSLRSDVLRAYPITLAAQSVVVNGVSHDTRGDVPPGRVDEWIRAGGAHPHVVGTTAAQTVEACREIARIDPEVLLITSSRKLIGSHAAGIAAARLLESQASTRAITVGVLDTGVTDVGAGLAVMLAGECVRAGMNLAETTQKVDAFCRRIQFYAVPQTLDYLVAGGRAGILRAKFAEWLDRVPMFTFDDGELVNGGLITTKRPPDNEIVDRVVARLSPGRRVWAAISHGGSPEIVAPLAAALRAKLDVAFLYVTTMGAGVYLHLGKRARIAAVAPIDDLGFTPGVPPIDPASLGLRRRNRRSVAPLKASPPSAIVPAQRRPHTLRTHVRPRRSPRSNGRTVRARPPHPLVRTGARTRPKRTAWQPAGRPTPAVSPLLQRATLRRRGNTGWRAR